MKQMVYSTGMFAGSLPPLILHEEEKDGYIIFIVSRRSHPCAYIDISKHFDSVNTDDIDCHGGITFNGDFFGANPFMRDKKYTTEEIFEDALNVFKQLKNLKGKS